MCVCVLTPSLDFGHAFAIVVLLKTDSGIFALWGYGTGNARGAEGCMS